MIGVEVPLEVPEVGLAERLDREQAVDEHPVAAPGRYPPGRGVRARDEAHLLEIGHHVPNRGRAEIESGVLREHAGVYRLAFGDVALDQGLEQDLRALVQHGDDSSNLQSVRANHWGMATGGTWGVL